MGRKRKLVAIGERSHSLRYVHIFRFTYPSPEDLSLVTEVSDPRCLILSLTFTLESFSLVRREKVGRRREVKEALEVVGRQSKKTR